MKRRKRVVLAREVVAEIGAGEAFDYLDAPVRRSGWLGRADSVQS